MTEEEYINRDEFMLYIANVVNPAREKNGLSPIREHEARECFRVITQFQREWRKSS